MEWNVPEKYGPHGELLFFLTQKEPATVPGSETFSSFFNADHPYLPLALIALHVIAEEGSDGDDVTSLVWEMNGECACPKSQCGKVKAKLGRKTRVCPLAALVKAMCATMRCTSSGCMGLVTRSLFFL